MKFTRKIDVEVYDPRILGNWGSPMFKVFRVRSIGELIIYILFMRVCITKV